jgi:hypothetical protein
VNDETDRPTISTIVLLHLLTAAFGTSEKCSAQSTSSDGRGEADIPAAVRIRLMRFMEWGRDEVRSSRTADHWVLAEFFSD